MQSSATVACRAFVLLACLIVIPLIALFGTSLPSLVVSVLDRWSQPRPADAHRTLEEAPPFRTADVPMAADPACPRVETPPALPPPTAVQAGQYDPGVAGPPVIQAGGNPYPPSGPPRGAVPRGDTIATGYAAPTPALSSETNPLPQRGLVPVAAPGASASGGVTEASGAAAGRGAEEASASGPHVGRERFTLVAQRLRQLGATYSRLESWGSEPGLYRFHCRVEVGAGPNLTRQFEATDGDPIAAMARVLSEVEVWRAEPVPTR